MISRFEITSECLTNDYHGYGKAWAAIKDGKVIALTYMSQGTYPMSDPRRNWGGKTERALPAWIRAVRNNAEGLDDQTLPTAWSSHGLNKLAIAASACSDCPKRPRDGDYRPRELLTMARAAIIAACAADFAAWRLHARTELAELGMVMSGMCSCTEFVVRTNAQFF